MGTGIVIAVVLCIGIVLITYVLLAAGNRDD